MKTDEDATGLFTGVVTLAVALMLLDEEWQDAHEGVQNADNDSACTAKLDHERWHRRRNAVLFLLTGASAKLADEKTFVADTAKIALAAISERVDSATH